MPFQLGTDAIRRTIGYLNRGKLIFRDNVKVLTVNYNEKGEFHQGARDFVHWNLCQIQYKNPNLQIAEMKNYFPTPFIRCWFDNGDDVIMDVFGKNNVQIQNQLIHILGKTEKAINEDKKASTEEKTMPTSSFGHGCLKHCLCEIPGHVPCPLIVPLPEHMTGKYKHENNTRRPKWWQD